jgi:hypothetical protein
VRPAPLKAGEFSPTPMIALLAQRLTGLPSRLPSAYLKFAERLTIYVIARWRDGIRNVAEGEGFEPPKACRIGRTQGSEGSGRI